MSFINTLGIEREYRKALNSVSSNHNLFINTLNNIAFCEYTVKECIYLSFKGIVCPVLKTKKQWEELDRSIKSEEKGVILLDSDKKHNVYFDVTQTNGTTQSAKQPNKSADKDKREKMNALWSCDIDIYTATTEKWLCNEKVHFDTRVKGVTITRNYRIPHDELYPMLAREIAHAYMYRDSKDNYNREQLTDAANAVCYIVCIRNGFSAQAPCINQEMNDIEIISFFEKCRLYSNIIQNNIDYFYLHGKPQFDKPEEVVIKKERNNYNHKSDHHNNDDKTGHSNKGFDLFVGCNDVESLKKRYRELSKAYHPDLANGDTESMKYINAMYEKKLSEFK